MTVREQIIKEIAATDDSQLLQDVLLLLQQRQREQQSDQPRRGSYEAFKRLRNTLPDEDAREMLAVINREFNHLEGEW